jgi:hypothetical protein
MNCPDDVEGPEGGLATAGDPSGIEAIPAGRYPLGGGKWQKKELAKPH